MIVLLTKLANLAGISSLFQMSFEKLTTWKLLHHDDGNKSSSIIAPGLVMAIASSLGFMWYHSSQDIGSFTEIKNTYKHLFLRNMIRFKRKLKQELNSIHVNGQTLLLLCSITNLNPMENLVTIPLIYFISKVIFTEDESGNDDENDLDEVKSWNENHHDEISVKTEKWDNKEALLSSSPIVSNVPSFEPYRDRSNSILTQNSEFSTISAKPNTGTTSTIRYLEMMVHNVSHTDLVLSMAIPEELQSEACHQIQTQPDTVSSADTPRVKNVVPTSSKVEAVHAFCRPRFSAFDMFCQRIFKVLKSTNSQDNVHRLHGSIMSFPRYDRSDDISMRSLVTPKPFRQNMLPVGFHLTNLIQDPCPKDMHDALTLLSEDLVSLRIRGKDMYKFKHLEDSGNHRNAILPYDELTKYPYEGTIANSLHLDAVFFPLLSSLLRRWHEQMKDKFGSASYRNVKKVLILVTGVGTPRNFTHSASGNSTKVCAELMEMFVNTLYPEVTVVKLHSEREIFRYDSNIVFANKELLPCVDAYRDAHARGEKYPDESQVSSTSFSGNAHFDSEWHKSFSVTLSFADGAPARTHAIQTSLRPYRPSYFHFWQLKTFWDESKICDDDVEIHSFESMETVPAMEVSRTNSKVQMVVEEMQRFRNYFISSLQYQENDIFKFWLRKTKKPVLAVLLVNIPGKGLTLYRGTNMEVSMPTGSLCAERNVIGTALAANPNLRREDLIMVAVLAIPLPDDSHELAIAGQNPSPPPGKASVCRFIDEPPRNQDEEKESFFSQVEEKLIRHQRPDDMGRSMSIGSFASIVEGHDHDSDDSWVVPGPPNVVISIESPQRKGTFESTKDLSSQSPILKDALDTCHTPTSIGTPMRKIKLSDVDMEGVVSTKKTSALRKKKTVLVHYQTDINPLKPCGACNEWLKKIAESNPHFKVVTFTDADCNGVYVTPCQE